MNWNHRVVRVITMWEGKEETAYMLGEVFYNDDGTPAGYSAPFTHSETVGGLAEVINQMMLALTHPIIDAKDMHYVEQDIDDDELPKTRANVIRELSEPRNTPSEAVAKLMAKFSGNYNADNVCALCGRAQPCNDCKGAA